VIWPQRRAVEAATLASCERDGKVFEAGRRIGFALDYCPNENARCRRQFGRAVVSDLASRPEVKPYLSS